MSIVLLFIKLLTALLGLTIPGYMLARALQLKESIPAAFPFSAFLICQTVVLLAILDWRISFGAVAATLALLTALFAFIALRRKTSASHETDPSELDSSSDSLLLKISITAALLLVAAVAFRTTLYPLGGFDTFTRWDALARAMVQYGSLSYYPPLTKSDFAIYVIPDGFPPLVASVYWWIYAASGSTNPQLTALSVILQLLSAMALTYKAVCSRFGKNAAYFTLLSLTASPLLISSFEMGQETGFLALAVAGQLCFALAAMRRPTVPVVIASALFAALGAQAREYGPALAMPGLLVLLSDAQTRRLAWKYALIAAIFSSPWYIRNWIITGNPLYPHVLPGGFPVNDGVVAVVRYYNEIYSPLKLDFAQWLSVIYETVTGITIAAVFGIPYLLFRYRFNRHLLISIAIIVILWFWSIGSTCGGVIYSMRVLAPAIILLAVAAGISAGNIFEKASLMQKKGLALSFVACSVYGILTALAYPAPVAEIASSVSITKAEEPESTPAYMEFVSQIKQLNIPSTGIFTDSAYLAQKLLNETRFRPVMPWYPEVAFLLNAEMPGKEMQQRFIGMNIRLVAISRGSLNNTFLYRLPLFRDTFNNWALKLTAGEEWALFSLSESK